MYGINRRMTSLIAFQATKMDSLSLESTNKFQIPPPASHTYVLRHYCSQLHVVLPAEHKEARSPRQGGLVQVGQEEERSNHHNDCSSRCQYPAVTPGCLTCQLPAVGRQGHPPLPDAPTEQKTKRTVFFMYSITT